MPAAAILDAGLSVEEAGTVEALEALVPDWTLLWRRDPAATPFQAPAWLLGWWRHLGGGELMVLALRARGRLVGLLPWFVWRDGDRRRLIPIGIGITDVHDVLIDPEAPADAAARLLDAALARRDRCDALEFHELRPGSPLLALPCPPGWADTIEAQSVCPVLALPPGAAFPGFLPHRIGRNLANYRNRAERLGAVAFETADETTFAPLLEELFRLHTARWTARPAPGAEAGPVPGMVGTDALRAFHRETAPALFRAGAARLTALRIGGRLTAVLYALVHRGRVCPYLSGVDPDLGDRHSPGTLIFGHTVAEAAREGAAEIDFLRGSEPYKYLWGARDRPQLRRVLAPPPGAGP